MMLFSTLTIEMGGRGYIGVGIAGCIAVICLIAVFSPQFLFAQRDEEGILRVLGWAARGIELLPEGMHNPAARVFGLVGVLLFGSLSVGGFKSLRDASAGDRAAIDQAKVNIELMNSGITKEYMMDVKDYLSKFKPGYGYYFDQWDVVIKISQPSGEEYVVTRLDVPPETSLADAAEHVYQLAVSELGPPANAEPVQAQAPPASGHSAFDSIPSEPAPAFEAAAPAAGFDSIPEPQVTPQQAMVPETDSSDLLIQSAGEKWSEGNIPAAIVLAEKALALRLAKYGPDHEKVKEVEVMLEAARKAQ